MTVVHGIGVSAGIAFGPVVRVGAAVRPPDDEAPAADAEERIRTAFDAVADDLDARAARAGDPAAAILSATAMLARDPSPIDGAIARAASGAGPATAIDGATREFMDQFAALGGYFAERAADLRDVGDRAIALVLGAPLPGVPPLTQECILVAHDLAPAETATLDRAQVLGPALDLGRQIGVADAALLVAQRRFVGALGSVAFKAVPERLRRNHGQSPGRFAGNRVGSACARTDRGAAAG
ncbi:phosphoenolpyruvate-utilizing N-terminal domain-containing protein [uncultured Demequina sp.]|uniref:phosphoenolpyruvate-utilizing N-terminal domain-containing protein n=1 Tax=uncultured Demequina sp. TaxID=693499 RepID=UPI0025FFC2D7|nr:phosphoenolpyruvate-utilizing N-terminal domain-containing protein [uncultured Demequina sp.]